MAVSPNRGWWPCVYCNSKIFQAVVAENTRRWPHSEFPKLCTPWSILKLRLFKRGNSTYFNVGDGLSFLGIFSMLRQADALGVANARYQLLCLLSWSWIPLNIFLFRCRAQETWQGHWFLYHRVSKNGVPGAFVIFVLYLLRTFSNTLMKLQLPLLPCCLPGCNSWHWSSASGEILHLSMLSCQIFF